MTSPVRSGTEALKYLANSTANASTIDNRNVRIPGAFKTMRLSPHGSVIIPRGEIISSHDRRAPVSSACGGIARVLPRAAAKQRNAVFRHGARQTGTAVVFAFTAA